MRNSPRFAMFVAASALAGPILAADLVTPSLAATGPGEALECRIVNLSGAERTVTISSYNSNGAIVGNNVVTIAAGAWSGVSLTFENGPGAGYCRFALPRGTRPEDFRASIDVLRFGIGIIAALPAH